MGIKHTWTLTDKTWYHFLNHPERYELKFGSTGVYELVGGDIILFQLPGGADGWNHARNVVGYGEVAPTSGQPAGTRGLLVNQHSVDRYHVTWDYNVPPNVVRQYWHVIY